MERSKAIAWLCLSVVAVGCFAATGCGTAQAEPLDVTYYYLPG